MYVVKLKRECPTCGVQNETSICWSCGRDLRKVVKKRPKLYSPITIVEPEKPAKEEFILCPCGRKHSFTIKENKLVDYVEYKLTNERPE